MKNSQPQNKELQLYQVTTTKHAATKTSQYPQLSMITS